jgi:hypothetical protein
MMQQARDVWEEGEKLFSREKRFSPLPLRGLDLKE